MWSAARPAARRAEAIARQEQDPALLAFALNGVFMQSFHRCGLAPERDRIGAELVDLASRHGFETYETLGHLIRMQACGARGDLAGADGHARAADALADRYGSPLVAVFTTWHRARSDPAGGYGDAVRALAGSGMPGLAAGFPARAELSIRIRERRPAPTGDLLDWGPYEPWARPHVLLAREDLPAAAAAVRALPDPPCDHLLEAMWCLAARATVAVTDRPLLGRALTAPDPGRRRAGRRRQRPHHPRPGRRLPRRAPRRRSVVRSVSAPGVSAPGVSALGVSAPGISAPSGWAARGRRRPA